MADKRYVYNYILSYGEIQGNPFDAYRAVYERMQEFATHEGLIVHSCSMIYNDDLAQVLLTFYMTTPEGTTPSNV